MRLTRLLFSALFGLLAGITLHAQSSTTATILRPYITSISPEVLVTGADSTVLTINGRRFQRGASVFFSARKLTNVRIDGDSVIVAVIPGELTTYPDVAVLMIENPDETKIGMRVRMTANPCSLMPNYDPFPLSLTPSTTTSTLQAFTLRILGGGFTANTRLFFGDKELAIDTRTTSASLITVQIPASLNVPGFYPIRIVGSGRCPLTSNFFITSDIPIPSPAITRVNPSI
jgi:hypothetical protein